MLPHMRNLPYELLGFGSHHDEMKQSPPPHVKPFLQPPHLPTSCSFHSIRVSEVKLVQLVACWGMSLGAVARKVARQIIHEASIKIPPAVQVTKAADNLSFKGPLGTSHLGLSGIDTLGDAAIRLCPASREIAICSPSKGFFGTLQVTHDHRLLGVYHYLPNDDSCCPCLSVCLHGRMGPFELQVKASYAGARCALPVC